MVNITRNTYAPRHRRRAEVNLVMCGALTADTDTPPPQISQVQGAGFRVQGLGFRVWVLGFGVWGSGLRIYGLWFMVYGLWSRV
jgi:hypothetical protein